MLLNRQELNITVSEGHPFENVFYRESKIKDKIMDIVIKSLGILFCIIGIVYLLRPDIMKWLFEFFKKGKRIYFSGLIRFALGMQIPLGHICFWAPFYNRRPLDICSRA